MSVSGLEYFREALAGFEDRYVLIGGSACDVLSDEAGIDFRATKDLDVVLLPTDNNDDFARALWGFFRDAGYKAWVGKDGRSRYYRFVDPQDRRYPTMLELFARKPEFFPAEYAHRLGPLPLGEDISSLSAIILDDDYYALLLNGLRQVQGVSVLRSSHLIPLKIHAHLDLQRRHSGGEHVNGRDLIKHCNDVFRLAALLSIDERVMLPDTVFADVVRFIDEVEQQSPRIDQFSPWRDVSEALEFLRLVYQRR